MVHPRSALAPRRPPAALAAAALAVGLLQLAGCARPPAPGASPATAASTAPAAGGAASATAALPRAVGGADCARTEGYDTVIVGAGLAGLAAARELTHLGRSVLVLEATDRIGGRGWTAPVASGRPGEPPVPIDYGGAWIHGVPTNPLTGLVDLLGFDRVRSELDVPFHAGGRWATAEEHARFNEAWEAYEEALGAAAAMVQHEATVAAEACAAADEVAAGEVAAATLCEHLDRAVDDDPTADRLCAQAQAVERGAASAAALCAAVAEEVQVTSDVAAAYVPREAFADVAPLVAATAGPLETSAELVASSAVDAAGFAAGEDDLVAQGMGAFVVAYGEGVPVCLGAPVSGIAYDADGVRVAAAGRTYRADTALVTVSVGVLRAGRIAFAPELPAWKRDAIAALRMGHMQKVILPFREDVFAATLDSSWVLAEVPVTPAERALAAAAGLSVAAQERRVMAFVMKPLGSRIAIAFHGGEWAELFERQCAGKEATSGPRSPTGCDDAAIDAAVRALSAMYGADAIGRSLAADAVHVTRWSLEPFTLGAYSVPAPGAWDERAVLGRPVAAGAGGEEGPLRLFFAGEACARAMYNGSYPGALETGLTAARDIHAELLTTDAAVE